MDSRLLENEKLDDVNGGMVKIRMRERKFGSFIDSDLNAVSLETRGGASKAFGMNKTELIKVYGYAPSSDAVCNLEEDDDSYCDNPKIKV